MLEVERANPDGRSFTVEQIRIVRGESDMTGGTGYPRPVFETLARLLAAGQPDGSAWQ